MSRRRDVWSVNFLFYDYHVLEKFLYLMHNVDPDKVSCSVASDLDVHCLPMSFG